MSKKKNEDKPVEEKKAENNKQAEQKSVQEQLKSAQEQLEKEKNSYLLLAADFENYKRRSAAERIALISTAAEKIILELLPVIDDCERAFEFQKKESEELKEDEGSALIYKKLTTILKARGLEEINPKGEVFDTETMDAVAQFPVQDEEAKGKVFDVVQKGYKLGEKVIRYAKVVVGQ